MELFISVLYLFIVFGLVAIISFVALLLAMILGGE